MAAVLSMRLSAQFQDLTLTPTELRRELLGTVFPLSIFLLF
jgi:hypothetical protein